MPFMNAITEQITREKALENATQKLDIEQSAADKKYGAVSLPIVPQSQEEEAALKRQGYVPYQNPSARSHSPTAYVTPERIIAEAERERLEFDRNLAYEDYQSKMNNPLFNLGDTVLDIANNTIGLPLKAFGTELFNNPSAKADKGYIQKLEDISNLQGTSIGHLLEKRRERDYAFFKGMSGGTKPSSVREWEYYQNKLTPAQRPEYLAMKRGVDRFNLGDRIVTANADGDVTSEFPINLGPNQTLDYLRDANANKVTGTKGEDRIQKVINEGYIAAQQLPTIKRSISLLDGIKTGGIAAAKLYLKQKFGEESADEGELSNLLGKAVISQYKQVFGAQFTEEEGNKLDAISEGLGKSAEANIRVLNNVLKLAEEKVRLSKDFANKRGDQDSIHLLDSYSNFDLGDGATNTNNQVKEGATATHPETGQRRIFRGGKWIVL